MDISSLVAKVTSGEIDLQPDFQRGQVWPESKKKRLIDTILRRWYVPAIHIVVNDELDREEILDGQQRLRTILEFMQDDFSIDGNIEPFDPEVRALHGIRYSDLPDTTRSRFRRFTVTTVRLRDYLPEEPGELFFRLNQLTALTAAEQRNALIGEPRNQIRRLAEHLADAFVDKSIGFTNSRMNFDDVLSRLAVVLEAHNLSEKVTASKLERRYREGHGLPRHVTGSMRTAIERLARSYVADYSWKQNKATLFSWLYFLCDNRWTRSADNFESFVEFFNVFEAFRSNSTMGIEYLTGRQVSESAIALTHERSVRSCIRIFNDRSSSRVNDVSSVVLRDICLNVSANYIVPDSVGNDPDYRGRERILAQITAMIDTHGVAADFGEQFALESRIIDIWERYNEARQNI